ncbi:restriction endonuclease subunit S, partial [Lactobacillus crispatus]
LQQRKLEQLKSIKKAMLQKLFVNKDMPILHFKGFNNIWKRSKLGNITKTISSKPYISGAYEEGKYEVVQQGDHPIAGYSNDIPFKNYKDVTLFGDHTLSLFKPRKAFLIASDGIKILSPSVTMDSLFYYYLLEKYKPRSEGYKRHFSILKKSVALFPVSINEQTQIAHVLIIIDKTISLQQERIEKLRNYKQFLLQNMLI